MKSPTWTITGIVDNVDRLNNIITFWLDDFDELQTVSIVSSMPKWLLKQEVAFVTSIPRLCVQNGSLGNNKSWGRFYLQDNAHLSEHEAYDELSNLFKDR